MIKFTTLIVLAAALIATPVLSRAQDSVTNAPATATGTNATVLHKKKATGLPFHGKIASVDATAGTFTVGQLSLSITSTTKITNAGKPATLADAKVGDTVGGYYKKGADGALTVTTLKLGLATKKKAPAVTPQ
jgi:hypothetical protein